jgi:hypothetical protein
MERKTIIGWQATATMQPILHTKFSEHNFSELANKPLQCAGTSLGGIMTKGETLNLLTEGR